ncbi:MAG: hypothetical protein JW843_05495 [Candidatus Aminicenantes bacterium]|nr:hypothetical protein [Candidatus Aminicenantes bacterium]
MHINRIMVSFVAFGALALAGIPASPSTGQVKLVQDLSIGGPDSNELFFWTGVSVDRDGNFYFADALDCTVKKFGPNGGFLKKAGGKGKGPGEFEKAVGVAAAGETVYAWDVFDRSIRVFDRELVFQRSLPMPGGVGALDIFPDGRLAAAVREAAGTPSVFLFSPDGAVSRKIPLTGQDDPRLVDSVSLVADTSGGFYVGYLFTDRVEKRNADGELVWSKSPFRMKQSARENIQGWKIPSETCIQGLALDAEGRIYVLGGRRAAHPGRDVLIFDPAGNAVGSFLLPEPSHSLYFDRKNRLHVAADGGVTMKRYRLVFER